MNRRHSELWIVWSMTIVFLVVCFCVLFTSGKPLPWASLGAILGSYIAFLVLYTLGSWFTIPKHRRVRPPMPLEYQQLKFGPISAEAEFLLSKAKFIKEDMHRNRVHKLYQLEKPAAEGLWRIDIEVVSDTVIAYRITFKSSDYIMMDEMKLHGEGRFLRDPG
ncbi:MAG: hypothetical protein RL693_387 [Verrucomicrobiota bacterium]|jgi:hypothetical protein